MLRISLVLSLTPLLVLLTAAPVQAVSLLSEDFETLALGPIVTFQTQPLSRTAWTSQPPSGPGTEGVWSIDNSAMPPLAIGDDLIGVAEFEGWTFVDKDWWIQGDDQTRSQFVSGSGTVAVADSDEWDDFGSPSPQSTGFYDTTLRISSIPLQGVAPNTAQFAFHSSWRPEMTDNGGSQKVSLFVKYNDASNTTIELINWASDPIDPNFHPDSQNEAINLPLQNPAGATSATLEFRLYNAKNNWWWALDNLNVFTGASPGQDGALRLIINRDSGQVKVINNTSSTVNLRGYSIESLFGTLDEAAATFLGESNANWQIFNNPATSELSEGYIPDQFALPSITSNPALGEINLGNAWRKYFEDVDDITFQYLVAGSGEPRNGIIEFTGNGGQSFNPIDLNFDGSATILDYQAFLTGYAVSLGGKTLVEQYNLGDLDGDTKHTVGDFVEFKRLYDLVNGVGAFEAARAAVPEPSSVALTFLAAAALLMLRRPRAVATLTVAAALALPSGVASAAITLLSENFDGVTLGPSPEENPAMLSVWNGVGPTGWVVNDTGVPGIGDPATDGIVDWAGWAFVNKAFWISADDQNRSFFTRASGNVMVADPDEWQDGAISPVELYDAVVTTRLINIPAGTFAGNIKMAFDSSWRPEGMDDDDVGRLNNQTATIKVSYNGGPMTPVLTWDSNPASPNFHPDSENEPVFLDLAYPGGATSMQIEFGLGQAWNDWWWAVDNVQVTVISPAVLRVNTTTGFAEIMGGDSEAITINGFDVTSLNGNLAPVGGAGLGVSKPDSVDGPDAGSVVGNGIDESWQRAAATSSQFSEFFLEGGSAFTNARTEQLGQIFNPATPAGSRDVKFNYSTTLGQIISGGVQYFTTPANADFDADGDVDGGDFLRWQRGVGVGTTTAQGDADGDHDVDGVDLAIWRSRFGLPPATPAAQPVPEPSGMLLVGPVVLALGFLFTRRRVTRRVIAALSALATVGGVSHQATAQVIPPPALDRNYRMGDTDPGAANGGFVFTTRDSVGQPNMNQLIHLLGIGGPTYITVTGRPDGGTGLGVRLNPNPGGAQHLKTGGDEALNYPFRSPSSIGSTITGIDQNGNSLQGTIDYTFITDRGFQLWVRPFATNEAHVVMDSNNHGVLVNTSGKFAMRYSGFDYAGQTTVAPNAWYHLMVVRPRGPANGSILYVNGVAEAAAIGKYVGEKSPSEDLDPTSHDNSALVIGSITSESPDEVGQGRYFRGIVDDLEMFVTGFNRTRDFGDFTFGRDNDYAAHFAPAMAGDINGDNVINMTDVTTFAANWRKEQRLTWMQDGAERSLLVGDLMSRSMGDFTFDGRINLADWAVLNTANPAMAAAAAALIGAVPEPSSWVLAAVGMGLIARLRHKSSRWRRKSSPDLRTA